MFETARRSEYPETFETEAPARDYIANTPIEGGRPWIRRLVKPIWGSFIVISGKDVIPKDVAPKPIDGAAPVDHLPERDPK